MKKLLMLSALAMVVSAPVLAQGWGGNGGPDGKGPGPRGGDPEKRIEKMFERHDSDGDGVVTKEEFLKDAEKRFAEIDANSDGEVTKEELKAHGEKMKERMKEKFEKMKKCREDAESED